MGNHFPPHFDDVPNQMDRFFSVVHENWAILDHPTVLPAYALWRLNWIHPFVEGNGRTARAACYYLICLKQGRLLPGKKIVPERIRENRKPYYAALQAADQAWDQGHFDVSVLAGYLARWRWTGFTGNTAWDWLHLLLLPLLVPAVIVPLLRSVVAERFSDAEGTG